jgi:hypothetical protein
MSEYKITKNGWIGTDLDGTLAYYEGWQGPGHIGPPIPEMEARVRKWMEEGWEIRIVTARAADPDQIPQIEEWLKAHNFPPFKVTNEKDYGMIQLWDDRCVQVVPNTGTPVTDETMRELNSETIPEAKSLADLVKEILHKRNGLSEVENKTLERVKDFLNGRATK